MADEAIVDAETGDPAVVACQEPAIPAAMPWLFNSLFKTDRCVYIQCLES